jgi:ribose transport system substrate-binding protein
MSSQRRMFLIAALVALVAAGWYRYSVTSADQPPPLQPVDIAFVTGGSGPYWQLAVNGAKAAAEKFDVNLTVETPDDDESLQQQTEILERVGAKVQGVAVSPLDAQGQTPLIDELVNNEVFVVTFDSDAPDSKRRGYVGTSNFAAGRLVARLVDEALPDGGKVAVLMANETKDNLLDRRGGFQEILAQLAAQAEADGEPKNIEVVDFLIDGGDADKCAELIRATLAEHSDLACFVGLNAQHGPRLMRVLKEDGQLGKIKIVAFDENPETLDGIESGDIFATVAQDPYNYGFDAVRMLAHLCRSDETELPFGTSTHSVSVEAIRQDNLDDYRAKVEARQAPGAAADDAG